MLFLCNKNWSVETNFFCKTPRLKFHENPIQQLFHADGRSNFHWRSAGFQMPLKNRGMIKKKNTTVSSLKNCDGGNY
jgi:hypothetical protein